jgi:hypothetical protein
MKCQKIKQVRTIWKQNRKFPYFAFYLNIFRQNNPVFWKERGLRRKGEKNKEKLRFYHYFKKY